MNTVDNERFITLVSYLKENRYIRNQQDFTERVKSDKSTVSQIMNNRITIPNKMFVNILSAFPFISPEWLLTGEGEMLKKNSNEEISSTDEFSSEYTTFLLPQSAMGGPLTGISADSVLLGNCEKVVSPIKGVDFAITVYGESMSPRYPSGSRLLIKKIDPNAFIDWGKTYVIDSCNGVIVKEVIKSSKEGYIICQSVNPDPKFSPFEVSLEDIYGMYRILMCLSAE